MAPYLMIAWWMEMFLQELFDILNILKRRMNAFRQTTYQVGYHRSADKLKNKRSVLRR